MSNKIGLFVDTFPILHKMYELCIKYAQHEVDELIIVIYDSPNVTIPLPVRTNWLRELYPNIRIIESWNDLEGIETEEIQKRFIARKLIGKKITHFYSTQSNVETLCRELNCENRLIASIRNRVCRATMDIQANSYKNISRVDPIVYKDLITKVVFVGAQSTGKSTITEALAKEYNTKWISEYARHYASVHKGDRGITIDDIVNITETQIQMEEEALKKSNKYLFTDTNAIMTLSYAKSNWHYITNQRLLQLANESQSRYDIFFLCGDDIPYENTQERNGEEHRRSFQRLIKSELLARKIPYIELNGTLEQRVDRVKRVLSEYEKYTSLAKNIGEPIEKQSVFQAER